MKATSSLILFAALPFLWPTLPLTAEEVTESGPTESELREAQIQERVQRVAEEIKQRRQARQALGKRADEEHRKPREIVYSPGAMLAPDEMVSALLVNAPLESAAETYALLAQKKVRVSAAVSKVRIVVPTQETSRTMACAAFEAALTKAGITIQTLDENTVALLTAEIADEDRH